MDVSTLDDLMKTGFLVHSESKKGGACAETFLPVPFGTGGSRAIFQRGGSFKTNTHVHISKYETQAQAK